jgi:UDP-N-acetylmuramate dehydrogenase
LPSADPSIAPLVDVALAPLTTLGVGGPARWFVRATTVEQCAAAVKWSGDGHVPLFVLGGGSNLVVADGGFDGLVLQVALAGLDFRAQPDATTLRVGAGEPWDDVVGAAVTRGLAGLECLSGIPGTTGGTPIQNVGAYGQDVSRSITAVTVLDRTTGTVTVLAGADCGFGYRTSRFKGADAGRFIVCDVTFMLTTGAPTLAYPDVLTELERRAIAAPTVAEVRDAVLSIRRRKGMVIDAADPDTRSVGSFFMNPVVDGDHRARLMAQGDGRLPAYDLPGGQLKIPAAWLIEQSGFARGYYAGGAGISTKHPLALVNRGGATARDVLALAVRIKRQVADRFGIWLRPEPAFVGFGDDPDVAFLQGDREPNVDTAD